MAGRSNIKENHLIKLLNQSGKWHNFTVIPPLKPGKKTLMTRSRIQADTSVITVSNSNQYIVQPWLKCTGLMSFIKAVH